MMLLKRTITETLDYIQATLKGLNNLTQNTALMTIKVNNLAMHTKDADRMANGAAPDQTAPP